MELAFSDEESKDFLNFIPKKMLYNLIDYIKSNVKRKNTEENFIFQTTDLVNEINQSIDRNTYQSNALVRIISEYDFDMYIKYTYVSLDDEIVKQSNYKEELISMFSNKKEDYTLSEIVDILKNDIDINEIKNSDRINYLMYLTSYGLQLYKDYPKSSEFIDCFKSLKRQTCSSVSYAGISVPENIFSRKTDNDNSIDLFDKKQWKVITNVYFKESVKLASYSNLKFISDLVIVSRSVNPDGSFKLRAQDVPIRNIKSYVNMMYVLSLEATLSYFSGGIIKRQNNK